jgi:hypothetical protein
MAGSLAQLSDENQRCDHENNQRIYAGDRDAETDIGHDGVARGLGVDAFVVHGGAAAIRSLTSRLHEDRSAALNVSAKEIRPVVLRTTILTKFKAGQAVNLISKTMMTRDPTAPVVSPPKCEDCGEPMVYISKLPGILTKAPLFVFRCYECCKIETAPCVGALAFGSRAAAFNGRRLNS